MHTDSIQTEYYQDNDPIPFNSNFRHSTTSYKKQMSPSSSNIALKIQQNIKQYTDQVKKNKDVIKQLECQRKFFEKLSQKQKDKIDQTDIYKLRQTYENKIFAIKDEMSELHEAIACYHEEQLQNQQSFTETHIKIAKNKQFLMETLIDLEKQNQKFAIIADQSQNQLRSLEEQILENAKIIKQKQAAHRKYIEIQIQIQKLQKKYNSPKKRT